MMHSFSDHPVHVYARRCLPAMARCMMKNVMRDFRPANDVTIEIKMAELAATMATSNATRNVICGVRNDNENHIS